MEKHAMGRNFDAAHEQDTQDGWSCYNQLVMEIDPKRVSGADADRHGSVGFNGPRAFKARRVDAADGWVRVIPRIEGSRYHRQSPGSGSERKLYRDCDSLRQSTQANRIRGQG